MSKKFLSVICFVLVLGFSSAAVADPIDINNPSFELAPDGNRVPGHTGFENVMAWQENADGATGFVGVDAQCPYASSTHCHRWPGPTETGSGTDVVYSYLAQTGANAYQVLDMNNSDANAVIMEGRRYTLTFDAILEDPADDGNPIAGSLFYPEDVCYPDENHVELVSKTYAVQWIDRPLEDCEGESVLDPENQCPDWNYDLTVKFVAESGADCIGKTLGVKLTAEPVAQEAYGFIDNIRLEWGWATEAYDPNPADGAELVSKNPTLKWKPGMWADQHEVYFGTDETAVANADSSDTTGIYKETRDVNNYTPSGPLVLGETYYWKITEVNSGYSGPVPPPWEGDVWSFRVEGHAYDPSPADGEVDAVFLGLELEWTAGTDAENHVVYFGTDAQAVADANTNSPEYKDILSVGNESYSPGGELIVGQTYYWRIDEKSAGGSHIITGDVWSFKVGEFLLVDNFESYINNDALYEVWDDYWDNGSDGEISLEKDVNTVRDATFNPQAAKLQFSNWTTTGGPKYIGSWFDVQDMTEVQIGSDWTVGGVKALTLYVRGDPCNVEVLPMDDANIPLLEAARPWIELEDTDSNTGYVLYQEDDMADVLDDSWQVWNVDLAIFDACGVTLSAIDRFTIGIGGNKRADQRDAMTGAGSLWVDDIRLYPPRCLPEYAHEVGNFNDDCTVDGCDLEVMARDWLTRGGWFEPVMPDVNAIIEYKFDEGSGTTIANTGTYGSGYNLTIGQNLDPNGELYMDPNNDPCWVDDPCRGWTLWFDGELGLFPRDDSEEVELGGDYLIIPPLNLTTDTITITAWIKPDPFYDAEEKEWVQKESFTGIVTSRNHESINPSSTAAAGLNYGGGSSFSYDGMLAYTWNDDASNTWNWDSDIIISDWQWNFLAVAIEPEKGTVYKVDESKVFDSATNAIAHSVETIDGRALIAGDISHARFFRGQVDDVRIYDQTLTVADIMGLAGVEGIVYVPCGSPADLVIGIKDPNDPNQPIDDQVDFLDYAMFADNWLQEFLWPF